MLFDSFFLPMFFLNFSSKQKHVIYFCGARLSSDVQFHEVHQEGSCSLIPKAVIHLKGNHFPEPPCSISWPEAQRHLALQRETTGMISLTQGFSIALDDSLQYAFTKKRRKGISFPNVER